MAKISQMVVEAKTKGTGKVVKDLDNVGKSTERLGRNQTRMGQASASAGRSFAAQSAGLGGLVGAYAGAAATVFALTAAFQALNNAARFEQIIAGTNALASSLGLSGQEVLNSITLITKGQLTLAESAQAANIALSAGLGADQIEGLTDVATRAARALGRPLTDTFTRLTRGVAKLEPELLDELGIFTRIEPAAEAYAKSIGKVASQLTNFEKRQAFANEAIKEGSDKFKDIDLETVTAAESLEKLSSNLLNIGTQVGLFIANFISPLVEIFGSGLPAAFLAASVARLVFGRALTEIIGSLENSVSGAERFADAITSKVAKAARVGAKETKELSTATAGLALNQTKGTKESKARFNDLVKLSRQNKLEISQVEELKEGVRGQIKLDALRASALKKKTTLTTKEAAELKRVNSRQKILNATMLKATAVQNAQSTSLLRLNKALRGVSVGSVKLLTGILKIFNVIALLTTVVSIIGAFTTAILDSFGVLDKYTRKLKEIVDFYRELTGFSVQDIAGRGAIRDIADGFDLSEIGEFSQVTAAIRDEFKENGARSAEEFTNSLADRLETTPDRVRRAIGGIIDEIVEQFKFLGEKESQFVAELSKNLGRGASQTAGLLDFGPEGISLATQEVLKFNKATLKAGDNATKAGKEQRLASLAIVESQISQISFLEAIEKGTARVEQLDKLRAATTNTRIRLEKQLDTVTDGVLKDEIKDQLVLIKLENARLKTLGDRQILIEQNTDRIRKQFAAELKASDKLNSLLRLREDGTVELIKSQKEQRTVQLEQLETALKLGYDLLQQRKAGAILEGEAVKRADAAQVAERALGGLFIKNVEALRNINKELVKRNKALTDSAAQANAQKNVLLQKDQLKLLQIGEKGLRRTLAFEKEALALADKRIDRQNKLAKGIKEAQRSIEQDFTSSFGSMLSGNAKADLSIRFAQEDLATLKKQQDENNNRQDKAVAIQKQVIIGLQSNLDSQLGALEQISKDERALEQNKIDARIATLRLQEVEITEKFKLIQEEAKIFSGHIEGLARILSADLTQRRELAMTQREFSNDVGRRASSATPDQTSKILEILGLSPNPTGPQAPLGARIQQGAANDTISGDQLRAIDVLLNQVDVPGILEDNILGPMIDAETGINVFGTNIETLKDSLEELADATSKSKLDDQITSVTQKIKLLSQESLKLGTTEKERKAEMAAQIEILEEQLKAMRQVRSMQSEYNRTILAISESVQSTVEGSLSNFFQTIADGEFTLKSASEMFNSFLRELVEGIRKQLLAKTLIEPLSEGIGSVMKGALKTDGTGGEGFFSTIGSFFSGSKAAASGGLVHMAGGGQVRDRVPAMLEPGEFVIRKPMAKAIGGPALGAMNATGTMPGGNISVNVTNTGTPQEATASPPRFDGDKMVVDIVMRDLRNNGPIRKSLRAGG